MCMYLSLQYWVVLWYIPIVLNWAWINFQGSWIMSKYLILKMNSVFCYPCHFETNKQSMFRNLAIFLRLKKTGNAFFLKDKLQSSVTLRSLSVQDDTTIDLSRHKLHLSSNISINISCLSEFNSRKLLSTVPPLHCP